MSALEFYAVDWFSEDRKYRESDRFEISVVGKTRHGDGVHVRIPFTPYMFVGIPSSWPECRRTLWMADAVSKYGSMQNLSCIVKRVPLLGFTNNTQKLYVQLAFQTIGAFKRAKWLLHRDGLATCDANIDPLLRFFHVRDITPASWVSVSGAQQVPEHDTLCIDGMDEYVANFQNIQTLGCDDPPPLVIASWDIECVSETGAFPESSKPLDSIITIGTAYKLYGEDAPFHRSVITLGTCDPVDDVTVLACEREADVVNAWLDELRAMKVDWMVGYNTWQFDHKYIDGRVAVLTHDDTGESMVDISKFGKFRSGGGVTIEKKLTSSAYGENNYFFHSSPGVLSIDLLQIFRKELKLDSYSLNAVSKTFLGDRHKIDLKPHELFEKYRGTSTDRADIAAYCVRDVELPLELMQKMSTVENLMQMANAVCCTIDQLNTRGQQIRVFSQLMRKARSLGFVCPDIHKQDGLPIQEKYEGATVLDACKGAYFDPISALDFASLYPSIMRAHCMCPSTIVLDEAYSAIDGIDYYCVETASKSVRFAQNVPCVVPLLLEDLARFRKQAKSDMARANERGDDIMASMYNGKQLAYKVSMNSIYGFFGATRGIMPLIDLAAAVTSTGRQMIMHSKKMAEALVPGTQVIYGDTDSILCKFKMTDPSKQHDLHEHFKVAQYVASQISKTFKHPVELEFEKVYFPYLLFTKKRYAGLMFTKPDSPDKIDVKGLQLVRRDSPPLVREVSNTMLQIIMYERSTPRALDAARTIILDVLSGKYPLENFIVSKALRSGYKNPMSLPHVVVSQKLRERGNPPSMGERIPYVFVRSETNPDGLQSQRAECPDYVREHAGDIELDLLYYVKNQLLTPIITLLDVLVDSDPLALIMDYPPIAKEMSAMEHTKASEIRIAKRVRKNVANKQREITAFFFVKDE